MKNLHLSYCKCIIYNVGIFLASGNRYHQVSSSMIKDEYKITLSTNAPNLYGFALY